MSDDLKMIGMHGGASDRIFDRARMLRSRMTESEQKLWEFLKSKPLGFKFRRQHPFDLYVLDFFCLKAKLSIEIDGESHRKKLQQLQDQFRLTVLNEYEIKEFRFTNAQVLQEFDEVKEKIYSFLLLVEK